MSGMFQNATSFNHPSLSNWLPLNLSAAASMFSGAGNFSQDLSSWCVPRLNSTPPYFAVGCPLPPNLYPPWGFACQSLEEPVAIPVALPVATCPGEPPTWATDAVCVDGRWEFSIPACSFFDSCPLTPSSSDSRPPSASPPGRVTIPPGSTVVLTGNVSISQTTLVVQITPVGSGQLKFQDCVQLTGDVVVNVNQTALPSPGSSVDVLVSERPECSNLQANQTVVVNGAANGVSCSKLRGNLQQSRRGSAIVLFVLFSLDTSDCRTPSGDSPSLDAAAGMDASTVGAIAGGVVGGIVLITAIVVVAVLLMQRSKHRKRNAQTELEFLE